MVKFWGRRTASFSAGATWALTLTPVGACDLTPVGAWGVGALGVTGAGVHIWAWCGLVECVWLGEKQQRARERACVRGVCMRGWVAGWIVGWDQQ